MIVLQHFGIVVLRNELKVAASVLSIAHIAFRIFHVSIGFELLIYPGL